jgi:hypothetical protein
VLRFGVTRRDPLKLSWRVSPVSIVVGETQVVINSTPTNPKGFFLVKLGAVGLAPFGTEMDGQGWKPVADNTLRWPDYSAKVGGFWHCGPFLRGMPC